MAILVSRRRWSTTLRLDAHSLQARREWKKRKYDYIVLNLDVVPIVLEQFDHIAELAERKRKVQERLETLDEWKELEYY